MEKAKKRHEEIRTTKKTGAKDKIKEAEKERLVGEKKIINSAIKETECVFGSRPLIFGIDKTEL